MSIIKKNKESGNSLQVGSTIEGKVVARDRSSLFIDLGIQGTGIIFGREFYRAKDVIKSLTAGDKIYAKIIELENEDGYIELSLRDATKEISWQKLEKIKNVKVLVINALRKRKHISHFNLEEALEFIKKVNPQKAYLTHISHYLGLHEIVNKELPENVELAYDGLSLNLFE